MSHAAHHTRELLPNSYTMMNKSDKTKKFVLDKATSP